MLEIETKIKNRTIESQHGMTVVEIIVVVGLLAILLLAFLTIYDWQSRSYSLETSRINANRAARTAMAELTESIAQGYSVLTSAAFTGPVTITTDADEIALSISAVDEYDDLILDEYDNIGYRLESGTLVKYIDSIATGSVRVDEVRNVTDKIDSISLTYDEVIVADATEVTITITASDAYRPGDQVDATLTRTVFLRNK